jgi:hypothetical protein
MDKKEKAAEATPLSYHKDSTISLKNKVLSVFLSGEKITAKELNDRFLFNDARKVISILRRSHTIADKRLLDGRKLYFLVSDTQLSLFADGGAAK